jgi:hypothetical protein
MGNTKSNKQESEDEALSGNHSLSIPRAWVPEINALIRELGSHSINSFCQAAVREMIDLLKAKNANRVTPRLLRQIDASRNKTPFNSAGPSDAGGALKKLDDSEPPAGQ